MPDIDVQKVNPHFGSKLAILSCTIALLTTVLVSSFYVFSTKSITLENGINTLAWQTRLLVPSFKSSFVEMQNDAFILSHSPGIHDYAQFHKNQAEFIARNRTPEQLQVIIATYFKTILQLRPHYTQIRLLSVKNNGKELIRVNKTQNGLELVEGDRLQEKGKEPYFKDSLSLKDGESYFSIVSQNREHGKAAADREITIRHIIPVFDEDKELFGFLVINANYEALLQKNLNRVQTQAAILVMNDAGDYTIAHQNAPFEKLNFHEDPEYVETPILKKVRTLGNQNEASFEQNIDGIDQMVYFIKIPFDTFSTNSNGRYLGIGLLEPKDDFLAPQNAAMKNSMIVAIIMICLAPLLAWPLTKIFRSHFEELWVKLTKSNQALIKSNEELDDFAYIASHDLKAPLRAIYNNTQFMIEDHGAELPEPVMARMTRLLDASMRMDRLIDDLLHFSRLSRSDLERQELDMNQIVDDAIKTIAPYIEERNGIVLAEPGLPPAVCDKVRVSSIVQNLIVNALKYNDSPQKIINIGYEKTRTHDDHEYKNVYFVKDNGTGIDAKFKDSIFRIFKRLHSPKTYGEGTGSGLTFTKKNVERHSGTIWFESVVGEGTVFYFTLKENDDV